MKHALALPLFTTALEDVESSKSADSSSSRSANSSAAAKTEPEFLLFLVSLREMIKSKVNDKMAI